MNARSSIAGSIGLSLALLLGGCVIFSNDGRRHTPEYLHTSRYRVAQTGSGRDTAFILCLASACPRATRKTLLRQSAPADGSASSLRPVQPSSLRPPFRSAPEDIRAAEAVSPPLLVYFDSGDWTLDETARRALHEALPALQSAPSLRIIGHTDNRGVAAANRMLAGKRAQAVWSYLIHHGVPERHVKTAAAASCCPLASNRTDSGRRLNRRAEILVQRGPSSAGDAT